MKTLHRFLTIAAFACALAIVAGCSPKATRPDTQAYDVNTKVTAVDAAVLRYVNLPLCDTNPQPCSNATYVKRLAEATAILSTATDAYAATVRDPSFTAGGVAAASVAVTKALAALTAILLELGITP